tara:strand:- start:3847 stop:4353 length:507 start_codon:yes stop_codon:yes gene_type:complete
VEENEDMEVAKITDANDLIGSLLEALPSEHTEMDISEFSRKNMSHSSFTSVSTVKELNNYINELQTKIKNLGSLEWDDTINNFVFGKNIQIVHKSLEHKPTEEKKSIITGFINEKIASFQKELENAQKFNPIGRSKSASPSFSSPFDRPRSSIEKKRPKSSLGKSSLR